MPVITRELRGRFGQRLNNNNKVTCRLRGTTWLAIIIGNNCTLTKRSM